MSCLINELCYKYLGKSLLRVVHITLLYIVNMVQQSYAELYISQVYILSLKYKMQICPSYLCFCSQ